MSFTVYHIEIGWDRGPFACTYICLLEQQNTKKQEGANNNCTHVQVGLIMRKTQESQRPTAISEVQERKQGTAHAPARSTTESTPKPSLMTTDHPTTLTPFKESARLPQTAGKDTCSLFSLPCATACKSLSAFLVWPLTNLHRLKSSSTRVSNKVKPVLSLCVLSCV